MRISTRNPNPRARMRERYTSNGRPLQLARSGPAAILEGCATPYADNLDQLRGRLVAVKATLERPAPRGPDAFETDSMNRRMAERQAARNFVFMTRPSARFADLFDHPVQRKPRAKKAAAAELAA